MENHPIPQDVTGFQFKLFGNTTIKQFFYIVIGVISAGALFQLPITSFVKLPLCGFVAFSGIALAYLPIGGRPMDLMIGYYIKALIRPTQFVYEKTGGQIYYPSKQTVATVRSVSQYGNNLNPFPKDKLKTYLETFGAKPKDTADDKEDVFLNSIFTFTATGIPPQPTASVNTSAPQTVSPAPTETPAIPINDASPIPKPDIQPKPQGQTEHAATKMEIKISNKFIGASIPVPDVPNLITGITRDARSNALPNILVEVKDKDGNPVRAFKTNETGRFASATSLTNGMYVIEFEDPKTQNKFEKITINAVGEVILPIEATSIDMREELRRSLFSQSAGNQL